MRNLKLGIMQYYIDYLDKNEVDRRFSVIFGLLFIVFLFFKFYLKDEEIVNHFLLWGLLGGMLILAFLLPATKKEAIIKVFPQQLTLHLDRGVKRILFEEIQTYYIENSLFRFKLMLLLKDGTRYYLSSYWLFNKKETFRRPMAELEKCIQRWKMDHGQKSPKRMKTAYEQGWFSLLVAAIVLGTGFLLGVILMREKYEDLIFNTLPGIVLSAVLLVNIIKAKQWKKTTGI